MSSRMPSAQSQQELALLLLNAGFLRDKLSDFLRNWGLQRLAFRLPRTDNDESDMMRAIETLARQGPLTLKLLDALEATLGRGEADFKAGFDRIRVDMELVEPPQALLPRAELAALKLFARKAGLNEGIGHARLGAQLPDGVRRSASTSLVAAEQMDAWFDAANRQQREPGDKPWMVGLLEAAVEAAAGEGKAGLREALNRLRVRERGDLRDTALAGEERAALEQMVTDYGIIGSTGAFLELLAKGLARTCLIRVAGQDKGTGFLAGDDLVLTAYHVLEEVIGGDTDAVQAEFRFDYREKHGEVIMNGPRTGLALSGRSDKDPRPWLIDCSPPTAEEQKEYPKPDITVETDPNELDFAIVRIADAVGVLPGPDDGPRGHFEIAPQGVPFDFPKGTALMIFGHPVDEQGEMQKASPQIFSIAPDAVIAKNPNLTRVQYRTNTRQGSSGSPVLTFGGQVVALHHLGKKAAYNQGIPLTAIAARPKVAAAITAGAPGR